MGNLRSLQRSVARNPERVWLAKQKAQENEDKSKQKEIETEKSCGECGNVIHSE